VKFDDQRPVSLRIHGGDHLSEVELSLGGDLGGDRVGDRPEYELNG
jgi:hypothetical protein